MKTKFSNEVEVLLTKKDYHQYLEKRNAVSEYNLTETKGEKNKETFRIEIHDESEYHEPPKSVDIMVLTGRKEQKIGTGELLTYKFHRF